MKNKVSVVVVTRNRERDLEHCLGSLACQLETLDELVVIDNNSSDGTAQIVKNFSKNVLFKVKYIKHGKIGYPHVYNRGLIEAKGNWVAFIDDDCVADPSWYKNIKLMTGRFPKLSVILGKSSEYYQKNVMALTKSYIDEVGKIGAIKNRLILDYEILDSKNIVYNKNFLNKNKILFDTNLLKYANGASEDCDLGMQIYSAGGVAIFNEKINVVHKDPTAIKTYYKKAFFSLENHLVYEKKWERVRLNINTKRSVIDKIRLFIKFKQTYCLNNLQTLAVICNVVVTFFYIKIMRKVLKSKILRMQIKQK
ncbi:MAG: glycosyltransferase family 2 protein [Candidatus Pacebacteria bacterium]|nr:glycosyltransferase family 2 protein [Candidatus Paceibacterota bacterium]NCS86555.1 glycosyltransferase family 2 protein [Candidatus Paceibacterota bacterium]PJC43400.1 MAG: hypothetical protein CO039_04135 [Candidatus Pacebacteria bacterium CG_4_9_14_0_2_um_filter_34_50]